MNVPAEAAPHYKGLRNNAGENNCFLNVCIQALWHVEAFRTRITQNHHTHSPPGRISDPEVDTVLEGIDVGSWNCTHCTFTNAIGERAICGACGKSRATPETNTKAPCVTCALHVVMTNYLYSEERIIEDTVRAFFEKRLANKPKKIEAAVHYHE